MASVSAISCHCKNICNRSTKRGACPCRRACKPCTDLCSCGWSLPCINRETPTPPSVSSCEEDSFEKLIAREEVDLPEVTRDRSTKKRKTTTKTKTAKRTKHNHEEVEDYLASQMSPTQTTCVRRRLEVGAFQDEPATVTPTGTTGIRHTSTPRTRRPTPATQKGQTVENFAAQLDEEALRKIVVELLSRDEGAFQDYALGYRPGQDAPQSPPPQPDSPAWCRCGNCRPMATATENKCCMGRGATCCATLAPNFYLVVEPAVLDLAIAHYNDFMVHDQVRDNAAYRHQAYRQFVLQRFGRLGAGNRRVVPSCVVLAIRERFPDPRALHQIFGIDV